MDPSNGVVSRGFTEGEFKFASFWVRYRLQIKQGLLIALMALNVALWGYVIWGVLDAYAISYPRESRIVQDIAQNQLTLDSLENDRPQPIQSGGVLVLQTTDNRYDLSVDFDNPNAQWWAEFSYRFNLSGEDTPIQNGFILPGSHGVLTQLGYRPKGRGGASAQLAVENIRWHRVDPSVVGVRYPDYANTRMNIAFQNVTFDPGVVLGTKQIAQTSFDVVNRGSYGYWSLGLIVRVWRGTSIVGVNQITLERVAPGETRHVTLDWFDKISGVTKTEVIPVVNLLDQNAFLPTTQF